MLPKSCFGGGEVQNKRKNIIVVSNSQKEKTWTPIAEIKIRDTSNLERIRKSIEKKNPIIIVLRSTKPSLNNKTINYLSFFVSKGWNIIKAKPFKQKADRKYANTISFMLSSPFLHSSGPDETHPENDARPMTEKEVNMGSVAANATVAGKAKY